MGFIGLREGKSSKFNELLDNEFYSYKFQLNHPCIKFEFPIIITDGCGMLFFLFFSSLACLMISMGTY